MKRNILTIKHLFNDFFCKCNVDEVQELLSPNIQIHCPDSWKVIHDPCIEGKEQTASIDQEYARAFEITNTTVGDLFAHEDKVAVRWQCTGIHRGDFFHFPASKSAFELSGQAIYQLDSQGRISEIWHAWDMHGFIKSISRQSPQLIKKIALLTQREKQCLFLFLSGKTALETALELSLSPRTIEFYFENIKDKLDCANKRELFSQYRLLDPAQFFS